MEGRACPTGKNGLGCPFLCYLNLRYLKLGPKFRPLNRLYARGRVKAKEIPAQPLILFPIRKAKLRHPTVRLH